MKEKYQNKEIQIQIGKIRQDIQNLYACLKLLAYLSTSKNETDGKTLQEIKKEYYEFKREYEQLKKEVEETYGKEERNGKKEVQRSLEKSKKIVHL